MNNIIFLSPQKEVNMYKIIAIMGKAGAGKDTFLHEAMAQDIGTLHEIVSCTTRPPREGEQEGVNYHFLTPEQFSEQLLNGEMLEATVFRDWCYGTSTQGLNPNKINIGVFNPAGVDILRDIPNVKLFVIYVTADDKERMLRQLLRENNPDVREIVRRFSTDEEDFIIAEQLLNETYNYVVVVNNKDSNIQVIVEKAISLATQYLDTIQ